MRKTILKCDEPLTFTTKDLNAANFSIEERGEDLYELSAQGSFSLGWLARLSSGLSDNQVSILRGSGKLIQAGYWEAEFDVRTDSVSGDPRDLDILSLIETEASPGRDGKLELSEYSIRAAEGNDNGVWVEVQGADKIGFLRNVLKVFSFYSLFPCAIEIKTTGSHVCDRFLLRGTAGTPPSKNALQGVKELLDDFIIR